MELREKKQKRGDAHETEVAGDLWDHTAVTADSTLVVRLVAGKRTQAQTDARVHDAQRRLRAGHLPAIFTDADAGYASAILEAFGRRYPAPRRGARPILRGPHGLPYGQGKKQYKGRGIERVAVRVLYGKARLKHVMAVLGSKQINTNVIARHNGTSRLRNQRKVRKTLAFSKVSQYHRWMSWLAVGLYNFCRGHGSVKSIQGTQVQHRSPAMAARLTDHIWTAREWLLCPVLGGQG
jgi:hypothetical protein